MEDRKYRQAGYKDAARQGERGDAPGGWLKSRDIIRCAACGTVLPVAVDPEGRCHSCGAGLHACTQCAHFYPGQRWECTQPIPERIVDKRARNECGFFSLRVTVERETSSAAVRPEDARRAFDNLFKKR
jgi:hypothetical protein